MCVENEVLKCIFASNTESYSMGFFEFHYDNQETVVKFDGQVVHSGIYVRTRCLTLNFYRCLL